MFPDSFSYLYGMEATEKSLHEHFIEVINIRGVHHQLNISNQKVKYFRNRIKNGYYVEERSMREILKKMGYKKKSDEIWF